jgi:membrane carboxypeptidase/penicillin-binding protein
VAILESRIGCTAGCAVLAPPELDGEQQFVIANSTGVFSYVGDDKRLGLGIEGDKLAVHWWFNYLITVTKENRKTTLLAPNTTSSTASSLSNTATNKPQSNILSQLTAK